MKKTKQRESFEKKLKLFKPTLKSTVIPHSSLFQVSQELLKESMSKRTHKISKIIVHCTATLDTQDYTPLMMMRDHNDRGFTTWGYHKYIRKNGDILDLRDEAYIGSHCKGENLGSLGVVYEGGCKIVDHKIVNVDTRTDKQKHTLNNLLTLWLFKHNLTKNDVYGHNDFNKNKDCPCYDVKKELGGVGSAFF